MCSSAPFVKHLLVDLTKMDSKQIPAKGLYFQKWFLKKWPLPQGSLGSSWLLEELAGASCGSALLWSTRELSSHLPWQCRTSGLLVGSSYTFKGLSFYVHFIKSLSAFQG